MFSRVGDQQRRRKGRSRGAGPVERRLPRLPAHHSYRLLNPNEALREQENQRFGMRVQCEQAAVDRNCSRMSKFEEANAEVLGKRVKDSPR